MVTVSCLRPYVSEMEQIWSGLQRMGGILMKKAEIIELAQSILTDLNHIEEISHYEPCNCRYCDYHDDKVCNEIADIYSNMKSIPDHHFRAVLFEHESFEVKLVSTTLGILTIPGSYPLLKKIGLTIVHRYLNRG